MCPNCRVPTNNVFDLRSLPENKEVFEEPSPLETFNNINSPAEMAKRLKKDAENLRVTAGNFMTYLEKLKELDEKAEKILVDNYEAEYEKIQSLSKTIIKMVNMYKERMQKKLTENLVNQRRDIDLHIKEIDLKKQEV